MGLRGRQIVVVPFPVKSNATDARRPPNFQHLFRITQPRIAQFCTEFDHMTDSTL